MNTKPTILNDSNFDETVASSGRPVLVDFHAEWCGPCKMLGPVIDQLSAEQEGKALVAKVDIDDAPGIASRYGIRSIPTLLVFKGGEVVATARGVQSKPALEQLLAGAA